MGVLNPREFAEKYLTDFDLKDLAQVGADIRISKLWMVANSGFEGISRVKGDSRKFAQRILIEPSDGEYILTPGRFYEWTSDTQIHVPENAAGIIVARSSMLRAGLFVTSGLWDPGYKGSLGGFISVQSGAVVLAQDERVGQLIMLDAASCQQYNGYFQGSASTLDAQNNKI